MKYNKRSKPIDEGKMQLYDIDLCKRCTDITTLFWLGR